MDLSDARILRCLAMADASSAVRDWILALLRHDDRAGSSSSASASASVESRPARRIGRRRPTQRKGAMGNRCPIAPDAVFDSSSFVASRQSPADRQSPGSDRHTEAGGNADVRRA
jgi:hypothetical protein